jgi:hypothetical protein
MAAVPKEDLGVCKEGTPAEIKYNSLYSSLNDSSNHTLSSDDPYNSE